MGKIVRYTLDPKNPPKPSPEYLARLDAMTDEDIDYSDIPDMSEATLARPQSAGGDGKQIAYADPKPAC